MLVKRIATNVLNLAVDRVRSQLTYTIFELKNVAANDRGATGKGTQEKFLV